jgi:hypothetical protein
MAIKLARRAKGIDCEYWRITEVLQDEFAGTTRVRMSLYVNRVARDEDPNGVMSEEMRFLNGTKKTYAQIYQEWKQPALDMSGNPYPNPWADATDA